MPAIDVDVVRDLAPAIEFRSEKKKDDGLGLLTGYFSKFSNWYRVSSVWEGDFLERTAPGFTYQTITEDRDSMRVLYDHGFDPQLGNKVLGTIDDLREDDQGPYYEVGLFDTLYNRELLPGLKASQYGASFRMKVEADEWDDEPKASEFNPKGLPLRTITRAKVMEFGPVTFPANPQATASVRSATDEFYSRLQQRDQGAYEAACRAANLPIPDFAAANPSRGRDGGSEHDGGPGNGAQSKPSNAALARHHRLILLGVVKR